MKYLVLTRTKDTYFILPKEQRKAIWDGTIAFIDKYQKMGKCKEVYMDTDMQGSASIWEINSEEETIKVLNENPMFGLQSMEIRPVIGWDIVIKAQMKG